MLQCGVGYPTYNTDFQLWSAVVIEGAYAFALVASHDPALSTHSRHFTPPPPHHRRHVAIPITIAIAITIVITMIVTTNEHI